MATRDELLERGVCELVDLVLLYERTQPASARSDSEAMASVTLRPRPEVLQRWKDAAARERLSLREWLEQAADLAIARGSTR